jgi:hypothetical protein
MKFGMDIMPLRANQNLNFTIACNTIETYVRTCDVGETARPYAYNNPRTAEKSLIKFGIEDTPLEATTKWCFLISYKRQYQSEQVQFLSKDSAP